MSRVEDELRAAFERHEAEVPPVAGLRERIEVAGGRARRRRARRRVAGAALVAVVAAALPAVVLQPWSHGRTPSGVAGPSSDLAPAGPVDVLLIGSDRRAGRPAGVELADTVMLLHVPADRGAAYMISLPRDGDVAIPGRPREKLSATLLHGGPELTTRVVEDLTGVDVDATVTVDFRALRRVTAAVGGVTMCLTEDAVPDGFRAGCQTVGESRVAPLLRTRRGLERGAYDRDRINQRFLRALTTKVLAGGRPDPARLQSLLAAAKDGVRVDGDEPELLRVAASLRLTEVVGISQASWSVVGGPARREVIYPDEGPGLYQAIRSDRLAEWAAQNPGCVER